MNSSTKWNSLLWYSELSLSEMRAFFCSFTRNSGGNLTGANELPDHHYQCRMHKDEMIISQEKNRLSGAQTLYSSYYKVLLRSSGPGTCIELKKNFPEAFLVALAVFSVTVSIFSFGLMMTGIAVFFSLTAALLLLIHRSAKQRFRACAEYVTDMVRAGKRKMEFWE